MADEVTIEDPVQRHRRVSTERRDRQMTDPPGDDTPAVTIGNVERPSGPTPEEALAAAQKQLADKDSAIAAERQARLRSENDAKTARDQLARESKARVTDRKVTVSAAKESATSDKQSAIRALKTARDAGDLDAEIAANEMLSSANFRLMQSTAELAEMELNGGGATTDAPRTEEQPRQVEQQYTPEEQAWIAAHPRFLNDKQYTDVIAAAARKALADGAVRGSPAYFRYIDDAHTEYDGGTNLNDRRTPASSTGAPPSRGNGGHGGGANTVKTLFGPVTVGRNSKGQMTIDIPPDRRPDWEEAAKINNMSIADYAYEQVLVAQERAAGGTGGLVTEEGSSYR